MCTTYAMDYLTNHAMELWGTMYYIVATKWHYEHYGLLAADYAGLITGDFTTKLLALHILHCTEEYCECFLMHRRMKDYL